MCAARAGNSDWMVWSWDSVLRWPRWRQDSSREKLSVLNVLVGAGPSFVLCFFLV